MRFFENSRISQDGPLTSLYRLVVNVFPLKKGIRAMTGFSVKQWQQTHHRGG